MLLLYFLILFPFFSFSKQHFVIVVASYNNVKYCEWNLDTIYSQDYDDYEVRYVDDCSTDGTYERVKEWIKQNKQEGRTRLIRNEKRVGSPLENQYYQICDCKDEDVIVIVDGDDGLAHKYVLQYLDKIYSSEDIWLTYGQFQYLSNGHTGFCSPFPDNIIKNNNFRKYQHIPSHLRTFKAWLFKKINVQDLMYENKLMEMTGDMASMIPMIEMASNGHFKFISGIMYLYNDTNPISEHCRDVSLQRTIDRHIRALPVYWPL